MKVLVLSMNSPAYADLASVTDHTKASYADRWGYDYSACVDPALAGPRGAWVRVELWRKYLRDCDWLFFTGTDAAITNPKISLIDRFNLVDTTSDFIVSADGNGLQSDSWIMRNSKQTLELLDAVLSWEGLAANEQDALNLELSNSNSPHGFWQKTGDLKRDGEPPSEAVLNHLNDVLNRSPVIVKIVPQKLLNAYPNQLYGNKVAGGSNQYEPGDFVIHIPGQTNETRIAFLKSIL